MKRLQERFKFGKLEELNEKGVSFNGRRLRKVGEEILVDMQAFVEERLKPVEISAARAREKKEEITETERSSVRSTCGALNWAGREGRPDAAAAASMFSSLMTEMKVEDIVELNKVVQQLKEDSGLALRIQPMDEKKMKWGVFSDASWANARNGKTQAGHMLVTFEQELLEGKTAKMNLLHWKSGKLQRTVNSTLAAETQSLARGVWRLALDGRDVLRAGESTFSIERIGEVRESGWVHSLHEEHRPRAVDRSSGHCGREIPFRSAGE